MKKQLLASAAILLGAVGFATPSVADVFVTGTWTKDVDITVLETILKTKRVTITVTTPLLEAASAAQAVAVHNQRITNVQLDWRNTDAATAGDPFNISKVPDIASPLGGAPPVGLEAHLNAIIRNGSFSDNVGVVMWNQDVGNNVNQANVLTAAVVQNAGFAEATNGAAQHITDNRSVVIGFFPFGTRLSSIQGSVNDNAGVTMLNQNSGFASNQYNSATLAVGIQGVAVALADADLGQWNQRNVTIDLSTIRINQIIGSINGNTGITAVNQNSGNFNNQAFMLSFAGHVQ
jgi:hypothetical protein